MKNACRLISLNERKPSQSGRSAEKYCRSAAVKGKNNGDVCVVFRYWMGTRFSDIGSLQYFLNVAVLHLSYSHFLVFARQHPSLMLSDWLEQGVHDDVIIALLKALPDARTLVRVSRVCRRLHSLCAAEDVWRHRCRADFGLALHYARPLRPPPLVNLRGIWGAPPEPDPHGLGLGYSESGRGTGRPSWRYARDADDVTATLAELAGDVPLRSEPHQRFADDFPLSEADLALCREGIEAAPEQQHHHCAAHAIWLAWRALAHACWEQDTLPQIPHHLRRTLTRHIAIGKLKLPAGLPTLNELWAHLLSRAACVAAAIISRTLLEKVKLADYLALLARHGGAPEDADAIQMPIDTMALLVALRPTNHILVGAHLYYDRLAGLVLFPNMAVSSIFLPWQPENAHGFVLALTAIGEDLVSVNTATGELNRSDGTELIGPALSLYRGLDTGLHWLEQLAAGAACGLFKAAPPHFTRPFLNLLPLWGPAVSRAVTCGIEIRAACCAYEAPDDLQMTSYGIRMRLINETEADEHGFESCRFRRRHWCIQMGDQVEEVRRGRTKRRGREGNKKDRIHDGYGWMLYGCDLFFFGFCRLSR